MFEEITNYFDENILSVSEINGYVKEVLDNIPIFRNIKVRGEISNFKDYYKSGHYYFSLKDENSVIKAVMFNYRDRDLNFKPEDGMKIVAEGRLSAFPRDGIYQLYIQDMKPDGKGELHLAYERLKKRLEEEGIFSDIYKKPLPKFPKTIGVITSASGAALQDIINITKRRWPIANLIVYPALVQGEGSEKSLINGVNYFNNNPVDVVIIGRGGGSIEDLWSFNSEKLARTIIKSNIPFISAVGHETDFTICDFACSLRAPTPSGAAEVAVPDINNIKNTLLKLETSMKIPVNRLISLYKTRLTNVSSKKVMTSPTGFIDERRKELDYLYQKIVSREELILTKKDSQLSILFEKLDALSPLKVLKRGYSAVYDEKGKVIVSVSDVNPGNNIKLQLSDGIIESTVKNVIIDVK